MKSDSFVHVHLVAMRYFAETVRLGSMRQASAKLHVAPSAVSRQILKMEEQLQCRLFDRLAEGIKLTPAGEILHRHILAMENSIAEAIVEIDSLTGIAAGHVLIASEDGAARDVLPDFLTRFGEANPGMTFSVYVDSAENILERLALGKSDVGLIVGQRSSSATRIIETALVPLGVAAAPTHPLAGNRGVRLQDLGKERMIRGEAVMGGYYRDLHRFTGGAALANRIVETNSSELIARMVAGGGMVGIRSPIGIIDEIKSGRIAFIPLTGPHVEPQQIAILVPAARTLSTSTGLLVDALKEHLREFAKDVGRIVADIRDAAD